MHNNLWSGADSQNNNNNNNNNNNKKNKQTDNKKKPERNDKQVPPSLTPPPNLDSQLHVQILTLWNPLAALDYTLYSAVFFIFLL